MENVELGYFGNIWVRQNMLSKGEEAPGHVHYFDHVTLLAKGSVRVEVEGKEPKDFISPTFIVIKKELIHKMTALEDGTVYYCVFALRDVNGEVVGDIYGPQHDPACAWYAPDDYWENKKKIENL